MMKRKYIDLLFILAFLLICLIPSAGMLLFGESEAAANEVLAAKPSITNRDGSPNTEVLSAVTDYIADRFAFRQELVTAWSWIHAKVFGTSVEEQVVLGRDDWLYYSETLDDYTGVSMSEEELVYAARNLALMQEYANSKGAQFVFTVAPNKNSLYPEYMPGFYPDGHEMSNAARLPAYLDEYNVNYTDLFTVFRETPEVLYFSTDSHWNSKGAALAADTILSSLGAGCDYFSDSFSSIARHKGDLYEMLYPSGTQTEPDPQLSAGFTYMCESDPNGGNAITIKTTCVGKSGSLLCWRDSFGISLYPYLAEQFGNAMFSRASSYDLNQIEEFGADIVLIELVERNLEQLVTNAPVFSAPVRQVDAETEGEETFPVSVSPAKDGRLTQITGEIPKSCVDSGSAVFLWLNGTAYEACLLRGADSEHVAFSAWLASEPSDSFKLGIYNNGILTLYNTENE